MCSIVRLGRLTAGACSRFMLVRANLSASADSISMWVVSSIVVAKGDSTSTACTRGDADHAAGHFKPHCGQGGDHRGVSSLRSPMFLHLRSACFFVVHFP